MKFATTSRLYILDYQINCGDTSAPPMARNLSQVVLPAGSEIGGGMKLTSKFGDTIPPHVVENKKYTTLYHPLFDDSIPVSM